MQLELAEASLTDFFGKLDKAISELNQNELIIESLYEKNEEKEKESPETILPPEH